MSVEQKLDEISGSIRAIHNTQSQHTSVLAKLEERSEQHEKRMDRTDRKAAGLGAASGFVASWAAPIARFFGMPF